jgi:hypothetical protein
VSSVAGRGLRIPALGIAVRIRDLDEITRHGDHRISLTVQTGALDSIHGGIDVVQVGIGASPHEAAVDAAHQWAAGVLPVLRSHFRGERLDDVTLGHMLVAVDEASEQYGWTVHLGPIIDRMYGDVVAAQPMDRGEIWRALFNTIHPFAAHSRLFWLECFAVRYADGRVDATCRYDNSDWSQGRESLLAWTASWPETPTGIVSRRQFMIFAPTQPTALPDYSQMMADLRAHSKRSRQ